jgi:hypothetical protein
MRWGFVSGVFGAFASFFVFFSAAFAVRPGQEPEKEPRRLREPLVVMGLGRLVGIWSGEVAAPWLRQGPVRRLWGLVWTAGEKATEGRAERPEQEPGKKEQ